MRRLRGLRLSIYCCTSLVSVGTTIGRPQRPPLSRGGWPSEARSGGVFILLPPDCLRQSVPPLRRGGLSAAAGILCATPGLARTLAQRGALWHSCAHIRSRGAKPHTAATRASRRGAGSLPAGRVDRVDVSHGGKIGTIGPFQANQPLSVALSERYQNAVFP